MTSSELRILDQIPQDVFKSKDLFHEVLKECWNQIDEDKKDDLKRRLLPKGELFSSSVQDETINLLLDGRLGMFEDNPVDRIYFNLKISKLAPDIKQSLKEVKALQLKAQQLKEKEYQMKIWSEISMRRKCLFRSSLHVACDEPIKSINSGIEDWNPTCSLILGKKEARRIGRNVDKRFHEELRKLTTETEINFLSSSDDEKDEMGSIKVENTVLRDEQRFSKMINVYKRKRKPEEPLDNLRSAMSLDEIAERVGGRKIDEICLELPPIPAAIKPKVRRKSKPSSVPSKSNPPSAAAPIPLKATASTIGKLNDQLKDSIGAAIFARKMELNLNKKPSVTADVFDFDDDSPLETPTSKDKPQSSSSISNQVSQIISSLTNPPPKSPTPVSPVVYDEPPPSFFSLIRNVFQENAPVDRKLTLHKLEELVKEKLKTVDPKLGWSHESVQSAMNFLSYYSEPCQTPPNPPTPTNESQDSSSSLPGSDMVPLVDYKEKNQQWQWIGGCRDGDDVMKRLSDEWANDKDRNPSSLSDPNAPVPPPLFPTQWIVKPATPEVQRIYREQEATRYNNPSKAFTFRIHDYEAVVGPVKGSAVINILNNANTNNAPFTPTVHHCPSASPNKAREHSLLVNDRPPFVTLLSLVRDAAARLPNGEGTRADICELLKDSQYLLPTVSDQQINQIVSGALDRLHYEKDPCVKYDTNRKVWIYLHRNRTESDFERLHEMQVAAAKAKRNLTKTRKPSVSTKTPIASPPAVGKSLQKGVPRPSPCKSSDSSSSSNTTSSTPIAARIAVSPLAPKPVAIVPQPRNVESNLLDILTKSTPHTYQFTQANPNFLVNKPCQNSFTQSSDRTNQVILKPTETGMRNSNLSPVVSVISVSSFNPVNRVITTSPMTTKDKVRTLNPSIQKIGVVATNQFNAGGDQVGPRQTQPVQGMQVTQPTTRPVQYVNQPQTSVTLTTGSQSVSIPSSMLISGRPGHVVLGGKSYVMATTSGGSIVLHPQASIPLHGGQVAPNPSNPLAGVVQPLSMRTLQGIKVIPVPTQFHALGNNQRVTPVNGTVQTNQQFVARFIQTRPGQIQGNQMIIPNSGYQQVILTPASQTVPALTVSSKQQIVNQAQVQPVNSFQAQIGTASQAPQIKTVKNNTQ